MTAIDEALHELAVLLHDRIALRFRNLFPTLLVEAAHQHVLHGVFSLPTLSVDQLVRSGPFRWNFEVNDFVHTILLCRDPGVYHLYRCLYACSNVLMSSFFI